MESFHTEKLETWIVSALGKSYSTTIPLPLFKRWE
jgi:hypothetical protein